MKFSKDYAETLHDTAHVRAGAWEAIRMIRFPMTDLMDEQKCHDFLIGILHPDGLCCPACKQSFKLAGVHRRDRAPILFYHCDCGRIYNAFTGTLWQGTHHPCSIIVRILQGIAQGVSTLHLASELGLDRKHLLERRHKIQASLKASAPNFPLKDLIVETDEMYQNAGEKRNQAFRPKRSAAPSRQ